MRKVLSISLLVILGVCLIVAGILSIFLPSISIGMPETGWKVWEPNWSPTGNLIAFRCVFMSFKNAGFDSHDLYTWSDVCVTDQNGKQFRKLTSGGYVSNFSWSPDGELLAWAHESDFVWETVSIWNSQEQTIETFFLSEEIQWLYDLKWSTDGKQLYLGASGATFDIAKKELLLAPKQEVDGNEFFGFIRSSDGEYLAIARYMNFPNGQADLVITQNEKPVYVGYEADNSSVCSWSPTDNVLAWTGASVPKNVQDPEQEYDDVLFLTYAPTGETIRYETSDDLFFEFSGIVWSPDGTSLAISDTGYSYVEILEFTRSDDGFPLSIVHHYQVSLRKPSGDYLYMDGGISWSPDGKYLVVGSDDQLWLTSIQDNQTQEFLVDFP